MKHRYTALLFAVPVLALAAFTGTALAGGGNGNGSGGSNGNSANAPGQTQQAAAPATAPATPPGQAKKAATTAPSKQSSKQSSTSASNPATGGSNANGVKPSNTTKHDTYAKASSDQTKKYGNGKTAGQIATQAGYGDATLHGPGNSQPHKAAPCPGSKHEVDVHALKNKASKCGTATSQPSSSSNSQSESANCTTTTRTVTEQVLVGINHKTGNGKFVLIHPSAKSAHYSKHADDVAVYETVTKTESVPTGADCASSTPTILSTHITSSTVTPATAVAPATASATASAPAAAAPVTAAPAAAGGVKGAVVALKPTKKHAAGGVLGATTRLGGTIAATRLPFTGLPLWIFALVAAGLIGIGLTMRRASANRI